MFRRFWAEFKAFAFQGNMIELAVAVVIGGAFSNVIHAMVTDLINPTITYAVTGIQTAKNTAQQAAQVAEEKVGLTTQPATAPATQASTTQPAATEASSTHPAAAAVAVAPPAPATPPPSPPTPPSTDPEPVKAVQFQWMVGRYPIGDLIGELINFLIVAFAVFVLIVKLLGGVVKRAGSAPEPGEPSTKECPECLSVIPIKARRCAHCTAVLEPPPGTTPAAG